MDRYQHPTANILKKKDKTRINLFLMFMLKANLLAVFL